MKKELERIFSNPCIQSGLRLKMSSYNKRW